MNWFRIPTKARGKVQIKLIAIAARPSDINLSVVGYDVRMLLALDFPYTAYPDVAMMAMTIVAAPNP